MDENNSCFFDDETYEDGHLVRNARPEAKVSGEAIDSAIERLVKEWGPIQIFCDKESRVVQYEIGDDDVGMPPVETLKGKTLTEALQLPATQSTVVPGVEELMNVYRKAFRENGSHQDVYRERAWFEAIHAHLLANAREIRYTRADLELMWGHGKRDVPLSDALATVGKEG